MCKHKLRNMMKPRALKHIAIWEIGIWMLMCGWIVLAYVKRKREVDDSEISLAHTELVKKHNDDWDMGLWIHSICSFLYAGIAGLLFVGVEKRSRFYVVLWMISYAMTSVVRVYAFIAYSSYEWLRWFEFYWILRIYFLICAFNYCLDLWSEHATAEHVDPPLLIPTDDPRPWRGGHNYPENPFALDQRGTIHGTGRHNPMHLDWRFVVHPFPTWFESQDEHGRSMMVIDNPAYNPDTR